MYELLCGDCIEVMKTLPAESVQCCITSPPYYGLVDSVTSTRGGAHKQAEAQSLLYRDLCGKCGARRIDQQIGLEESPDAYVAKLVDVFREVRRLLHPSGVLWLNLGDSYAANRPGGQPAPTNTGNRAGYLASGTQGIARVPDGLKPKDLIGIPWLVAFALRADGWWLRSEIIWHKKAPMPESVTDRPTKSHEQVFLLTKSANYFYDADAIREPHTTANLEYEMRKASKRKGISAKPHEECGVDRDWYPTDGTNGLYHANGRNKRSVWTLGPEPYAEAHFATMPTKLVEPCILAGTSAHGCCAECGAPWERVVEKEMPPLRTVKTNGPVGGHGLLGGNRFDDPIKTTTVGWQPTCTCNAAVVPCTVFDPFAGSGTTLAVALKHGRRGLGIELNPNYIELAHKRITEMQPLLLGA